MACLDGLACFTSLGLTHYYVLFCRNQSLAQQRKQLGK